MLAEQKLPTCPACEDLKVHCHDTGSDSFTTYCYESCGVRFWAVCNGCGKPVEDDDVYRDDDETPYCSETCLWGHEDFCRESAALAKGGI